MTIELAHKLGVRSKACEIKTVSGRYGNDWTIFCEDRLVTQGSLFGMIEWLWRLGRYEARQ